MKKKIIILSLSIFLLFPKPAYAILDADLIAYFNTVVVPALTPIATLVQQGMQNLQLITQSNNTLQQVQGTMRMLQDIQTYQLNQQSNTTGNIELYAETQEFINNQRAITQSMATNLNNQGALRTYIFVTGTGDIQTIGWSNIDALLSILIALPQQNMDAIIQQDWANAETSIDMYKMQMSGNNYKQIQKLELAWRDEDRARALNQASSAATPPKYNEKKVQYEKDLMNAQLKTDTDKLDNIRYKITQIKIATAKLKQLKADQALIAAQKVFQDQQAKNQNADYVNQAVGIK